MGFIVDICPRVVGLLFLIITLLVPLAVVEFLIGTAVYVLSGPEARAKMTGWVPGVQYGVRKALGLARALRNRSRGEAE